MRQLIASLTNEFLIRGHADGKLTPITEVVLVVAEATYEQATKGKDEYAKDVISDTLRFFAPPDVLRKLAEQFIGYAEDAEALGACVVERPKNGQQTLPMEPVKEGES